MERVRLNQPSTAADNGPGHDATGKFAQGNTCGKGNPHHSAVARLRSALLAAVDEKDIAKVVRKLVAMATAGDVPAAKVLLAYVIGRPAQVVVLEQQEYNPDERFI